MKTSKEDKPMRAREYYVALREEGSVGAPKTQDCASYTLVAGSYVHRKDAEAWIRTQGVAEQEYVIIGAVATKRRVVQESNRLEDV